MPASFRLIVAAERGVGHEQVFDFDQDDVRVGRNESAHVRLPHANVSGAHLELRRQADDIAVIDLGSTNGTWVGGTRLQPHVPRSLTSGDSIDVGRAFVLEFRATSPVGAKLTGSIQTADIARRLVEDLLASGNARPGEGAAPELVGQAGAARGRTVALPAPDSRTVLGRGEGCDVVLVDPDLSREHFEVRRTWNEVTVVDLLSKNGTYVDGHRLVGEVPTVLRDGAMIRAGLCELRFRDPADQYLRQLADFNPAHTPAPVPLGSSASVVSPSPHTGRAGVGPVPEAEAAAGTVHPERSGMREAQATKSKDPPAGKAEEGPTERSSIIPLAILGLLIAAALAGLAYLFTL